MEVGVQLISALIRADAVLHLFLAFLLRNSKTILHVQNTNVKLNTVVTPLCQPTFGALNTAVHFLDVRR